MQVGSFCFPNTEGLNTVSRTRPTLSWQLVKCRDIRIVFYTVYFLLLCKCTIASMDERTIMTPIPKCRLYWCFCSGWCSNFVGSESGQKQSVKLLKNMVYNTTQHSPISPQPHTVCLLWKEGRGRGGQREGRGATVHNRGRKYQHD
jgi:hypothetical protein